MNGERRGAVYYDVETDQPFREAVIDGLIVPSYMRALDRSEHVPGRGVFVSGELYHNDGYTTYDLYARKGDDAVTVRSSSFAPLERLTAEAARVLYDEVRQSDLPNILRSAYLEPGALWLAEVSLFTKYEYHIELDIGKILIHTILGFALDGNELHSVATEKHHLPELDERRQTIFEPQELVELVRALHQMKLVTQDEVRTFLDAF